MVSITSPNARTGSIKSADIASSSSSSSLLLFISLS
jgi:hypothetical protein